MISPAFSATPSDGFSYTKPLGAGNYRGWCAPGHPQFNAAYRGNAKLIGAWDFAGGITVTGTLNGQHVQASHAASIAPALNEQIPASPEDYWERQELLSQIIKTSKEPSSK